MLTGFVLGFVVGVLAMLIVPMIPTRAERQQSRALTLERPYESTEWTREWAPPRPRRPSS